MNRIDFRRIDYPFWVVLVMLLLMQAAFVYHAWTQDRANAEYKRLAKECAR